MNTSAQDKKQYEYHQDCGHGWLKVPVRDLNKLKIESQISSYSYLKDRYAYLEEDCDMSIFLETAKRQEWNVKLIRKYHNTDCKIRSFNRYPTMPGSLR